MKRSAFLLLITFVCIGFFEANAQLTKGPFKKNPLKYSKRFDAFYREGPLKFAFEPGPTFLWGDLKKKRMSYGAGLSASYKVNAPLDAVAGLRYFNLASSDGGISTSSGFFQLNLLGRYYLRYDRVRTNLDRRRPPKSLKLFLVSGINISRYGASASNGGSFGGFRINAPIGIGMPIRVNDRISIVPEIQFYYTLSEKIDALSLAVPNDRFLVASVAFEFNPAGKRKHPRTVHKDEVDGEESGEGGGGGSKSKDSNSEDEDDSDSEDTLDEPVNDPPATPVTTPTEEKEEPIEDNGDKEKEEGDDSEDSEDDGEGDDSWDDGGN